MSIRHNKAWKALESHRDAMRDVHLSTLFEQDGRFDAFSRQAAGLTLDFSKQRIRRETLDLLLDLAREAKVEDAVERLLSGRRVNLTEDRPALHTALRLPQGGEFHVEGEDVQAGVHDSLDRMQQMVDKLQAGQWRGVNGRAIKQVINLGVGGSDLGPLMVVKGLEDAFVSPNALDVHFASTIDGSQLAELLPTLDADETLFIYSSKSFGTIDTSANAYTALAWLAEQTGGDIERLKRHHFIGVSTKPEKMTEWGIAPDHQLLFWDWVGGRYSFWSAIGLPIAIRLGMDNFRRLLAGGHAMDEHFASAPLEENLPVLFALLGIWNTNFLDIESLAVLPYDGRLKHLPGYLQQLEMESNGKSSTNEGEKVDYNTCPILWGEIGPNGQHAFYQLLHQGTRSVACDFIAPIKRYDHIESAPVRESLERQHRLSLANCFAQSRVLMLGDDAIESSETPPAHKRYAGNQPSSTLLFESLSPESLGALVALYEHKVYVQGAIWDIDSFDQWGVELGKKIANETADILESGQGADRLDDSSRHLIETVLGQRGSA
ncbi:glucose-6-phosphate isomerase [Kushneria indalinina]|uniref:Glucose-6-phosphate isomerase n=1 Tax=Kushneria indalinina DSM 14324 TaxID=1122140 RepID=A0A3D9DUR0_9GAMM|nr:glucose-6-phosphate isomerase [Kushneria indalinina]REC94395.1 glucose-6-phosphate isomerase [Kushneria indalinina DSM 14324]